MCPSPENHDEPYARKADLGREGRSGSSSGDRRHQPSNIAERTGFLAFRQALEELGRIERSIEPSALRNYPVLLECNEVKRRTRLQTQADPAQITHEAILDAISSLPTERDRLLGQAILAANPNYEGDDVNTRKRTLDEQYGISENVYKRHRPKVLDYIIAYLESFPTDFSLSSEPLSSYYQALAEVNCVVMDVVRLAYAVQAGLFVSRFNSALRENHLWQANFPADRCLITDAILAAYVGLIHSTVYCFGVESYSQRPALDGSLNPGLNTELSDKLFALLDTLWLNESLRKTLTDLRFYPNLATSRYENNLLYTAWQIRLEVEFDKDGTVWRYADFVLSCCNGIGHKAYQALPIRDNERSQIMTDTQSVIAHYYGISASTLIGSHSTLAEHIAAYWTYAKYHTSSGKWSPELL